MGRYTRLELLLALEASRFRKCFGSNGGRITVGTHSLIWQNPSKSLVSVTVLLDPTGGVPMSAVARGPRGASWVVLRGVESSFVLLPGQSLWTGGAGGTFYWSASDPMDLLERM